MLKNTKIYRKLYGFTNQYITRNTNKLSALSAYIRNLCIDEYCSDKESEYSEYKDIRYIDHHLPLIDNNRGACSADNWNMSENTISKVKKISKRLYSYADVMINKYYSFPAKKEFKDELLPPWIVFPYYPADTIKWRMGTGEAYTDIFVRFLNLMPDKKRSEYKKKYPAPEYMAGWYNS